MSGEELIRACAEGNDGAAWNEFVARFHRPIGLSIIRATYQWGEIPQQVLDDLVQDTYLKLCSNKCRKLADFAEKHPDAVVGYIKTIAMNVARDHFKSQYSQKRGSGDVEQIGEDSDPEGNSEKAGSAEAMLRELLLKQIDECIAKSAVGPDGERDRTIFWLYYRQGLTAKDIAALPGFDLTAKGVESVLVRVVRLVRDRLISLQQPTLKKVEPGEKGFLAAESF